MRTVVLYLALIIVEVYSICNSTTFWNPLINACVNRNIISIQSVLGNHPISTTPILRPGNAWSTAQALPVYTPMISCKAVSIVNYA